MVCIITDFFINPVLKSSKNKENVLRTVEISENFELKVISMNLRKDLFEQIQTNLGFATLPPSFKVTGFYVYWKPITHVFASLKQPKPLILSR